MTARQGLPPELSALIAAQDGMVATRQLLAGGLTQRIVERRAHGWTSVARGVHWTREGEPPFVALAHAGLLIGGAGSRLARRAAARVDGFADEDPRTIELLVQGNPRPAPGFRFVREAPNVRLPARPGALRRTRAEDTVLDLASSTDPMGTIGWITRACQRRVTTPARLLERLTQRTRVPGRALLLPLLTDVSAGATNELELAFLHSVIDAHRLPRYVGQSPVPGAPWLRDGFYRSWRVVIELDGQLGHDGFGRFRDRRRDNRHAASGAITLRYGWHETMSDPCGIAAEIAGVLQSQGWTGRKRRCRRCPRE